MSTNPLLWMFELNFFCLACKTLLLAPAYVLHSREQRKGRRETKERVRFKTTRSVIVSSKPHHSARISMRWHDELEKREQRAARKKIRASILPRHLFCSLSSLQSERNKRETDERERERERESAKRRSSHHVISFSFLLLLITCFCSFFWRFSSVFVWWKERSKRTRARTLCVKKKK